MSRDNKRNIFTQRVVVPQKETKRIYPADRKRSYVEVVREEKEDVGGLFRKGEPSKGSARPMQRTATLCSHQETNEWLQKAWVGRLKNRGMFERVEEELQWMLDGEVTPCYWIDDWIFLPYLDDSKAAKLIQEEKQTALPQSLSFRNGARKSDQTID